MRTLFSTLGGRVPRSTYWMATVALWLAFIFLFVLLDGSLGRRSTLLLSPPLLLALTLLSVKRMRDRGRSPLWLLTVMVPAIGPLWLMIELAFRKGTPGDNQYGADPLDRDIDYLTVS